MSRQVDAYPCPICDELHEDSYDAAECCFDDTPIKAYRCKNCNSLYRDELDADECCE